jgi:hypothetical protein
MAPISCRSAALVNRIPDDSSCRTAASQPTREKMKTIAGSRPSRSSASTTSYRDGTTKDRGRSPPPSYRERCAAPPYEPLP